MTKILTNLLDESKKAVVKEAPVVKEKVLREWVENKDFDKIWEKHVPASGEAKTMFGEACRCLGRLEYDYYNNGFGNAYDATDDGSNRYGDDEPSYVYVPRDYYADMGRHLVKFVRNKQAHADVISAATFVSPSHNGAKPWDSRPDPRFKKSVEILKNWFVENEKEHA
jgi:hypothetical protein